ncbi:MAG: hypothetical protein HQ504_11315 [Rhodospirillaceae bacterium]|nr:hypothetical protein [Rhodospirillaceae bacterium]
MPKYEVALYNKEVREALADNDKHARYEDSWGDIHYIEIKAANEEMATEMAKREYPALRGFVIEEVTEIPEDSF